MNRAEKTQTADRTRLKACVRGAVQGVGFRPFIFRLASELELNGWVKNTLQGVFIELEGERSALERFLLRVEAEKPARSSIQSLEASWLEPVGYASFEIRKSESTGGKSALILPDIATCPECLAEIFDPQNRRHLYPFTNCTHCGPRFSIVESLPYDRGNTSMKKFAMCARCQAEYENPRDRRFHAQPNACPDCGPRLELWPGVGGELPRPAESGHEALLAAAQRIRAGEIVAVKGLGGFHLMTDARSGEAVGRLRERKHREEKPFALMFPNLESVRMACELSASEERLLRSPEAPIVLLRRRSGPQKSGAQSEIADSVAPGNPNLGVVLPYTPLHHLLMAELNFPVVATSGNLSDEPICIDEREAAERLGGIADVFLVHNRPIVRHVDDSITRVVAGREIVLRRARGYAPLPITLQSRFPTPNSRPVLAVGAHLKNTVALAIGRQVFISQHIGDLETDEAFEAFRRVIADFQELYGTKPGIIAADLHPDYLSTKYARALQAGEHSPQPAGSDGERIRIVGVQHHLAHVLSCMAENEVEPPSLGVSWDGTGYGLDGTIWGGELFRVLDTSSERVAHLRPFRLPGGDQAVKEPRRTAVGLLFEMFGARLIELSHLPPLRALGKSQLSTLMRMLERDLNAPRTSSVGRLFDGVAALIGLRELTAFEGQAAMALEFALDGTETDEAYEFGALQPSMPAGAADFSSRDSASFPPLVLDWEPVIRGVLDDIEVQAAPGLISAKFHNALVELIAAQARRAGEERVVLSGGCFQNRYLTERSVRRLREEGFRPYWHQRVPPNDGGIALGQIIAAMREAR